MMARTFFLMKKHSVKGDADFCSLVLARKINEWTKSDTKIQDFKTMLVLALPWKVPVGDGESLDDADADAKMYDPCDVSVAHTHGSPQDKAKKFTDILIQSTLCPMVKAGKEAHDLVIEFAKSALHVCKQTPRNIPDEFGVAVGHVEMCFRCILEMAGVHCEDADCTDVQNVLSSSTKHAAGALSAAIEKTPFWEEIRERYLTKATHLTAMMPKIKELVADIKKQGEVVDPDV